MMKFKKLLEPFIISITISVMALANFWHVIRHYFQKWPGSIFIGISHYHEDYFYYLTQVTQGTLGAWEVKNLYTTEPIPASPLWFVNILLGKVAVILNLAPWTVFDLGVFAASIVSLWLFYIAAKRIFPKNSLLRIGSFLISVTATNMYTYVTGPDGTRTIKPFVYFYNYTSSLNRLGGVVHLILQNILSLFSILIYAELLNMVFVRNKTGREFNLKLTIFSITIFVLAFINPVYVLVNGICIILVSTGYLIRFFNMNRLKLLILMGVVTAIPLIIPVLAVSQTFNIPFYQYFRWWESTVKIGTLQEFTASMGYFGILVLAGLPVLVYKKRNPLVILGSVWTLLPVILYFTWIPYKFQFPYFRLHQPASYVFLAAMATTAINYPGIILSKLIVLIKHNNPAIASPERARCSPNRLLRRPSASWRTRLLAMTTKDISSYIFIILISIYIAKQIPMIRNEIDTRVANYALDSWLNHLDKNVYEGLIYLKNQPDDGKGAIAFNNLEFLVPVVSGKAVYQAHKTLTPDYAGKIGSAALFFLNKMAPDEARNFLTANNIEYVLWHKADGSPDRFDRYPFLEKIFENEGILVYKLIDSH